MNEVLGVPGVNLDSSSLLESELGQPGLGAAPQHLPQLEHTARSALWSNHSRTQPQLLAHEPPLSE